MNKLALTATLALLAVTAPAFAQSELDRLETATVATGENMEAFLNAAAPELATVMPDWTWDAEMRTAATCTIDAIRAEGGDAAVTDYINAMEDFAGQEITSLQQMATETPVPINPTFAQDTGIACGSAEIAMRRMQESGLMEAMMDPAIMGRLMGN